MVLLGNVGEKFTQDVGLPLVLLKEEYDDRTDRLAKSSFMRLPVKEMKKWAHLAPTDWRDLYRNLPLKHFGAQNSIGSKTIEIMHNKKVSFIFFLVYDS